MKDRVVVVEDDELIRDSLLEVLEDNGYEAIGASDGQEALDKLAKLDAPPCLIVLDLMMPGMDGFQFLERFRQLPTCRRVPVIVWTGKDLTAHDQSLLREAVQAVVPKSRRGAASVLEEIERFVPLGAGGKR